MKTWGEVKAEAEAFVATLPHGLDMFDLVFRVANNTPYPMIGHEISAEAALFGYEVKNAYIKREQEKTGTVCTNCVFGLIDVGDGVMETCPDCDGTAIVQTVTD